MRCHVQHSTKSTLARQEEHLAHRKEHQEECKKETSKAHTQATKQKAEQIKLKSPILDDCKKEKLMDPGGAGDQETGPEDSKRDLLFY